MFRSFQTRLVFFSWILFALVEAFTFFLVQNAIRDNIFDQARQQLIDTNDIFNQRVAATADTLAEGATILASDYGFRQAFSTDDRPTILSALHNLGHRFHADRFFLLALDGKILADTGSAVDAAETGDIVTIGSIDGVFPFKDMIETAENEERAAATAVLDNHLYRLVVVPIKAPVPIAWIVVGLEIGDPFATELQRTTTIPIEITFAFKNTTGQWQGAASTLAPALKDELIAAISQESRFQGEPASVTLGGSDYVTLVANLPAPRGAAGVEAILQYSLDVALKPYQPLFVLLLGVAGAALILSLGGAVFIARSIAKPIRTLDVAARRIQAGRYDEKVNVAQRDEIGRLSETFNQMMEGIAEREARIAYQARHDAHSGLPNRVSFEGHVSDLIIARHNAHSDFSVFLLQLGRFSEINSTLGHDTGEQLIRKVGKSLKQIIPEPNAVARHANNMFAMVLDSDNSASVSQTAHRVLALFDNAISVAGFNIDVTATLGEARYPEHGTSARTLMQHADTAIFEAKRLGRPYSAYDSELDPHKPERLSMMSELRAGLDEGQFQLYFQPKVDLSSDTVNAAEALIRWIHPKRGFMAPDSFIPLAEKTGNIQKLTAWVLEAAVKQLREWLDAGIDVKVAINLSAKDLGNRNLPSDIARLMAAHDVPARNLILEITESAVMQDPLHALDVMKHLNEMGLTLSIDDYGTGYSSMAYLRSLPVHEIKIDKSFVLKLASSRGDEILVRSTIDLGHNLGLKVTAEGVEDAPSLEILKAYGCETAQGYFVSRPIPADAFAKFVTTSRWARGRGEPQDAAMASGE
ncbi:MAG: EAL domain-containing protein [Rhodospirillaceae bacterium]|nr:EAL domain-containing protein [Rhodospirillaceae bacterium]